MPRGVSGTMAVLVPGVPKVPGPAVPGPGMGPRVLPVAMPDLVTAVEPTAETEVAFVLAPLGGGAALRSVRGSGTRATAGSRTVSRATTGAGPARRLAGRIRGLVCRGHRQIIARTAEAHCSPRHK
ncbi:hypothetical protein AQJ64_21455 [Streptomyces griseoruber]|uniref:Uncharacterized protein n=1 Tax=Streptomyces griseoruber TaxID=1943 RepID=A0A124I2W4_9ACTN|nr:hypothetical protein AQJ64_21455 [Streptomyces griseoruber]